MIVQVSGEDWEWEMALRMSGEGQYGRWQAAFVGDSWQQRAGPGHASEIHTVICNLAYLNHYQSGQCTEGVWIKSKPISNLQDAAEALSRYMCLFYAGTDQRGMPSRGIVGTMGSQSKHGEAYSEATKVVMVYFEAFASAFSP